MRVKRYVVDSMPDALQRIRADLGKNAIILDTKTIRTGGFLGLFGKRRIEVIAADDEASKMPAAPAPVREREPAPAQAPPLASPPMPRASERTDFGIRPAAAPAARQAYAGSAAADADRSVRSPLREAESPTEQLMREMKQMKDMLAKLSASGFAASGETSPWPPAFLPIEERLREQDVLPEVIRDVFEKAIGEREADSGEWTVQEAGESVRKVLVDLLTPDEPRSIKPDTKIVHFVGPTGVGKTTTIAKLAAEQVLKHGRKIGFITSDTYRIAAIEQLRTYANILNVPLEVVFSPLEMNKAFQALADRDLIFMDTAGRNYRNEMLVSELNALLRSAGNSETFLVLSLSAKYRDMKTVVDNFSRISLDNVLYTKLDETESYGSIINLAHEYGFRGTYVADGQNVPDDISELDEARIVDLILGGSGDE